MWQQRKRANAVIGQAKPKRSDPMRQRRNNLIVGPNSENHHTRHSTHTCGMIMDVTSVPETLTYMLALRWLLFTKFVRKLR